jgi:cell wall-associated NlpC family hydrolase
VERSVSIRFLKRATAVLSLWLSATCLAEEAAPARHEAVPSLLERAKAYVGVPYRYGGASPSGFDCSGFVRFVFRGIGVALNRSSRSMATQGARVARGEIQPGDLLFFRTLGKRISHVGIYLGEGLFIHAGSRGGPGQRGVKVARLDIAYYDRRLVQARRVVPRDGPEARPEEPTIQTAPGADATGEVGPTQ